MMKNVKIPLCFYPTRVVLVDDDAKLLSNLQTSLNAKGIVCETFSDAKQALQYLTALPYSNKFLQAIQAEDTSELAALNQASLRAISNEVYNPKRFEDVSVVVVDYNMPDMMGDDFFSLFNNPRIKKIMLTGVADYSLAIDLLNNKMIDSFFRKELFATYDSICEKIIELQRDYFNELSAPFTEHLFTNHSYVTGRDYAELVQNYIQTYNIVEHYTYAKNGSKFLVDKSGKIYWLVLATEDEMAGFLQTAEYADAPEEVTKVLKNKTRIPFLFKQDEIEAAPNAWQKYLVTVEPLILNDQSVYFNLVNNNKKINNTEISFYQSGLLPDSINYNSTRR